MLNTLTFLEEALLKEMLVQALTRAERIYYPHPDANRSYLPINRSDLVNHLQKILKKVEVEIFPHVEEKIVTEVLRGLNE